jgi:DNA invertase Pin-like site-specific DNA recombinase
VPLKIVRNYPPYHEMEDSRERRAVIVELRLYGWSARAIAGYLRAHKSTVHRALKRLAAPRRGPLAVGASGALP